MAKKKLTGDFRRIKRDLLRSDRIAGKTMPSTPLPRLSTNYSADQSGNLSRLQGLATANQRSSQMSDMLKMMQGGLGGYTSQETQAMREQQARDTNQNFMTGRSQLMRGQNMLRTGGAARSAQLMQLARSYGDTRAGLEQDLMVKNADEVNKRRNDYSSFLQGLESDEFTRGRDSRTDYTNYLSELEKGRRDNMVYNNDQEARDRATKVASMAGILDMVESRRNARKQNKLREKEIDAQSRRSSGGGGSSSNTGYGDAVSQIINSFIQDNY